MRFRLITTCKWITTQGKRWASCCHFLHGMTCKGYRKCDDYEPENLTIIYDKEFTTEVFPSKVLMDLGPGITFSHAEDWNRDWSP